VIAKLDSIAAIVDRKYVRFVLDPKDMFVFYWAVEKM